jgi:hypothetical protein
LEEFLSLTQPQYQQQSITAIKATVNSTKSTYKTLRLSALVILMRADLIADSGCHFPLFHSVLS